VQVTTSRDQSIIAPICRYWERIISMLSNVHGAGWTLLRIAAFSAGNPKASNPIGKSTLKPLIRL
jgi:hypothetical protein